MVSGVGIVIAIAALVLLSGLKVLNEYERAVVFRLGRLNPFRGPGVIFIIPILERAVRVELKNIDLPQDMQRAIAAQAEAERERRAKVIAAEGEFQAAQRLAEAAEIMGHSPITLQLRYLQTLA